MYDFIFAHSLVTLSAYSAISFCIAVVTGLIALFFERSQVLCLLVLMVQSGVTFGVYVYQVDLAGICCAFHPKLLVDWVLPQAIFLIILILNTLTSVSGERYPE